MLHHFAGWLRSEARVTKGRRRWARWIGRSWARVHYGYSVEPTWLDLHRRDLVLPRLPAGLEGLRIAHLSDFHLSHIVAPEYLAACVATAMAERPDLVLLTGDFVTRKPRRAFLPCPISTSNLSSMTSHSV